MEPYVFGLVALGLWFFLKSESPSFQYRRKNGSWRAYFRGNPPSRSHVLHDNNGYYVCWSTPISTRPEAQRIAALWQQRYGRTGSRRLAGYLTSPLGITIGTIIAIIYFFPAVRIWDNQNQKQHSPQLRQTIPSHPLTPKSQSRSPKSDIKKPTDSTPYKIDSRKKNIPKPQSLRRQAAKSSFQKRGLVQTMDRDDRAALSHCFETKQLYQTNGWSNRETGNEYKVTLKATWYIGRDKPCRRAIVQSKKNGKVLEKQIIACRNKKGTWVHQDTK